jgi:hypothetical protein
MGLIGYGNASAIIERVVHQAKEADRAGRLACAAAGRV